MTDYTMSKSMARKENKINENIKNSLLEEYRARKAKEAEEQKKADDVLLEAAGYSYVKKAARMREKSRQFKTLVEYEDNAATVGLTNALVQLVEKSLLLDAEEYKKLNEGYEDFIKETIKSFLKGDNLNESIENEHTKNIMANVMQNIPNKEVGVCLTEAQMYDIFGSKTNDSIKQDIHALSGDIMERVANVVENSRVQCQSVNDNLNAIHTESVKPLAIRNEIQQRTILEALAINEAKEMLEEGKEYDSDLALANAITYITILETLDATGLVTIGTEGYNRILEMSGVRQTPTKRIATTPSELNETEVIRNVRDYTSRATKESSTFKSFADWKKERQSKSGALLENSFNEESTIKKLDYTDRNGNQKTTNEVYVALLREGYDEISIRAYGLEKIASLRGYKKN